LATRIGINGFGRIGRQVLKGILERHPDTLEVVAINDLVDSTTNAHLFKYDSNYGRFDGSVAAEGNDLVINNKKIRVFSERNPGDIPWSDEQVEIVIESTGLFTNAAKAGEHRKGTVKKVVISAPATGEDVTLVLGVNSDAYDPSQHNIISNASCTTNGLAPVVKVLLDNFGFEKGQMTTVHSYTNSQKVLDVAAKDLREARAAGTNIMPLATGAAKALKLVIPEVDGILDGAAYRVPTPTVSIVEVVALTRKDTTSEEVNQAMFRASAERMNGILAISDEPVGSLDRKGKDA
jgi:glyceraldehyde 3-phosphate dehydrogenase